jgi:hypothetical protein
MAHPKKSKKNTQGKKKSSSSTNKPVSFSEKKLDNLAPLVRVINNRNYF